MMDEIPTNQAVVRRYRDSRHRATARHNAHVIQRAARRRRIRDAVLVTGGAVIVIALLQYLNFLFS